MPPLSMQDSRGDRFILLKTNRREINFQQILKNGSERT